MSIKFSFLLIMALCLLGFVLSTISAIDSASVENGDGTEFCISKDDDCGSILRSEYSSFLGISLGKWGVLYYMFIVLVLFIGAKEWISFSNTSTLLMSVAGLGVIFSLYMIVIMSFVLHAVCTTCLSTHITNLLMAGLLFRHLRKYEEIV